MSRSPSIIIAYIINKRNIDAEVALKMVKKNYPQADPNLDFMI